MNTGEAVAPYAQCLREVWGQEEFEALCVLADHFARPININWPATDCVRDKNVYIVVGERTFRLKQMKLARKYIEDCLEAYAKRVHVLFSGAIFDREEYGELPGSELYHRFFDDISQREREEFARMSDIDNLSDNTGRQALRIAHDAEQYEFTHFIVLEPVDHIARFVAVLASALRQRDLLERSVFLSGCYDAWNSPPFKDLSPAREAFGPLELLPGEPEEWAGMVAQRCGQYGERWKQSLDNERAGKWAVGGMAPTELLAHIKRQ